MIRPAGLLLIVALGVTASCGSTTGGRDDDLAVMERIGPAPETVVPSTTAPTPAPTQTSTTAAPVQTSSPATTVEPSETVVQSSTTQPATPDRPFTVARPIGSNLFTHRAPDDPVVWWRLPHPGPYAGDRVVLVLDDQGEWLHVDLPVRPNGTTGWIRRADVTLSMHRALIRVDLSERRLWAWEDGALVAEGAVALGTGETPTPTGSFYVNEVQAQAYPDTIFGSWIVGTSGFSDVLEEVDGGDPAMAIHGTNDPTVLGLEVSLGCVRVHDDVVTRLAKLPLGTPVEIVD